MELREIAFGVCFFAAAAGKRFLRALASGEGLLKSEQLGLLLAALLLVSELNLLLNFPDIVGHSVLSHPGDELPALVLSFVPVGELLSGQGI